jgi:hypothetical protein
VPHREQFEECNAQKPVRNKEKLGKWTVIATWTGFVLNFKFVCHGKQMNLCLLKVEILVTKVCMTTDMVIVIEQYQGRKIMVVTRWLKQYLVHLPQHPCSQVLSPWLFSSVVLSFAIFVLICLLVMCGIKNIYFLYFHCFSNTVVEWLLGFTFLCLHS